MEWLQPSGHEPTSRCFVASWLRDMSSSLVLMLRRCMSLSKDTRFTVVSLVDFNRNSAVNMRKWAALTSPAQLREDSSNGTSERDSYHNHKFTGLRRIGHVDGSHGFLKVLVCILILAPTFEEDSLI